MGFIPDPQEIQHKYKLTTNYRLDAVSEEQLAQQMNQMNESLAEMVQAIEELNSQLEEYVRTLTDSIGRFRQMIRPVNGNDVPHSRSEDDEYLERMRTQLQQIERQTNQEYQRVFSELHGIHELNSRAISGDVRDIQRNNSQNSQEGNGQHQQRRQGFLSSVFSYVRNVASDFFQVLVLSS